MGMKEVQEGQIGQENYSHYTDSFLQEGWRRVSIFFCFGEDSNMAW